MTSNAAADMFPVVVVHRNFHLPEVAGQVEPVMRRWWRRPGSDELQHFDGADLGPDLACPASAAGA
jgi:hypothetical protein